MKRIGILWLVIFLFSCDQNDRAPQAMNNKTWNNKLFVIDDSVIDGDDPFEVIAPLWWTGDIYDGPARYEKSLESFSKPQRLVFASMWYISEVNNGGHDQFYFNSTGIVWPDAAEAFSKFGISELSAIILESAKRLGGNPSLDRGLRQNEMDKYNASFDDLDDRFYDFSGQVNMDAVIMKYIRNNRDHFYFNGHVSVPE